MTDYEIQKNAEIFSSALANLDGGLDRLAEIGEHTAESEKVTEDVARLTIVAGASGNLLLQPKIVVTGDEEFNGFFSVPAPQNMANACVFNVPKAGVAITIGWTLREGETPVEAIARVTTAIRKLGGIVQPGNTGPATILFARYVADSVGFDIAKHDPDHPNHFLHE